MSTLGAPHLMSLTIIAISCFVMCHGSFGGPLYPHVICNIVRGCRWDFDIPPLRLRVLRECFDMIDDSCSTRGPAGQQSNDIIITSSMVVSICACDQGEALCFSVGCCWRRRDLTTVVIHAYRVNIKRILHMIDDSTGSLFGTSQNCRNEGQPFCSLSFSPCVIFFKCGAWM